MQVKYWFIIQFCFGMLLVSCKQTKPISVVANIINVYKKDLNDVSDQIEGIANLVQAYADTAQLKKQFRKARGSYKKVEWLTEYYYPYTAKKVNGPALDEVEPDEKSVIIRPEGFQVIEEMLFAKATVDTHEDLLQQTKVLHSNIARLRYMISLQESSDAHIFDALRLEIFRIISLGITGFDSPVANNSLREAAASLKSVQDVLSFYLEQLTSPDRHLSKQLRMLFDSSVQSLNAAKDFNSFDRMKLITRYLNPISESMLAVQHSLKIPIFTEPRALRADAKTLFALNIFNADFYTPGSQSYSNSEKMQLGQRLFYDGIFSKNGKRSCASCHQPEKAFTDGLPTSLAVNGTTHLRRNAPTLINAALQPSLFFDMRVSYLEDQAKDVISNKDEMHGSLEDAMRYIDKDTIYKKLFNNVYPNEKVSWLLVKNCIAAYIRSLVMMNSRFDQYVNGNSGAMNKMEVDGFNLFSGKAKCGTCHFIPLFNGANPPIFNKIDAEVIGVPASADSLHPLLDADLGVFELNKVPLHKRAFKTPTLRNIELTGPYMHNGIYKTLEQVIDFYNRGGGSGLGLPLENQTLPGDSLNLSGYEKRSLVAFLKTLTDTANSGARRPIKDFKVARSN